MPHIFSAAPHILPRLTYALGALLLMAPYRALAQQTCDKTKQICNPINTTNIAQIVGFFLTTIIPIIGAVALLLFIVGAIQWIISGGNPEKVKQGRDTVVWAVLGSAVIIGSYVALRFIFQVLTAGTDYKL